MNNKFNLLLGDVLFHKIYDEIRKNNPSIMNNVILSFDSLEEKLKAKTKLYNIIVQSTKIENMNDFISKIKDGKVPIETTELINSFFILIDVILYGRQSEAMYDEEYTELFVIKKRIKKLLKKAFDFLKEDIESEEESVLYNELNLFAMNKYDESKTKVYELPFSSYRVIDSIMLVREDLEKKEFSDIINIVDFYANMKFTFIDVV